MEKPQSLSASNLAQILSRCLRAYGRNFVQLIALSVVCHLPVVLFRTLQLEGHISDGSDTAPLLAVIGMVCDSFVTLCLARGLWDTSAGKPLSVLRSTRAALPHVFAGLGIALAIAIAFWFGSALFTIIGLVVAAWMWVALPVCVVEDCGPSDSLWIGQKLVGNSVWMLLGFALTSFLWTESSRALFATPVDSGGSEAMSTFLCVAGFSVLLAPLRATCIVETYRELRRLNQAREIEAVAARFGEAEDAGTEPESP